MKTDEGEENDPQRNPKENYIGQNRGKEEINLVAQLKARYQQKEDNVKRQRHRLKSTNQEWRQSHAVPIKSNTTKKKVPPDQTPIEPNKGSALPSKGKQKKDQAPNQIEALIKSRHQKDKILILEKKTSDKGNQGGTICTAF